jgi:hypothetical protein
MAYRNDLQFMEISEQPNAGDGSELVETTNEMQGMEGSSSTGGFNSQSWLSAEQSMSGMTPSSGSMYDKNGPATSGGTGLGGGHNDSSNQGTSGSQGEGSSTGLTPSSNQGAGTASSTSNTGSGGKGPESRVHMAPGQMGDSNRGSFQTSPVSPLMPGQTGLNSGGQNQFFADPTSFGLGGGLSEQAGGFGMSNGWGEMTGQNDMGGEGVLRALIDMGPMNAMDLSTWNPTNENMRQ